MIFIIQFIFIAFFSIWLIFCLLISFIGILIPTQHQALNSNQVDNHLTICKTLENKDLITSQDYRFESETVAPLYDQSTFHGYLFIVAPIIIVLNQFMFLDTIVLFFVKKWIKAHKLIVNQNQAPDKYETMAILISTFFAKNVGHVIILFRSNS